MKYLLGLLQNLKIYYPTSIPAADSLWHDLTFFQVIDSAVRSQMNRLRAFSILCAASALVSIGVRAQNAISTGSISGQVTNRSGGAVVGATVTAANQAAGIKLNTKTNGTGFYSFPSLGVGLPNTENHVSD